jgi:hypothetical protein
MRSLQVQDLNLTCLDDIQDSVLDPIKWALNSTYHTPLQATPGQLTFLRDMVLPTSYIANW